MTDIFLDNAGGIITEELTDDVREEFVGGQNNLTFRTIQEAHASLREAAERYNYLVESVIDSLELVETQERGGEIAISFGWAHPQAERYEFGTSPHTIQGQPVLSFVWQDRHDPPEWVRDQFDRERSERGFGGYRVFLQEVDVAGIVEIRFVRGALRWLEQELGEGGGGGRSSFESVL